MSAAAPAHRTEFDWGSLQQFIDEYEDIYVLDAMCGTGTSGGLYALKNHPSVRVVMIDNGHDFEYVKQWIPQEYHDRVLFIKQNIENLGADSILAMVKKVWPTAEWSKFVHMHGSPSCRSHSKADRNLTRHRDKDGRPLTALAKADDRACQQLVRIMLQIKKLANNALYTIENPVSRTFELQDCIKALQTSEGWVTMTGSYCKCASPQLDSRIFPRKDTLIIAANVPKDATLPICNHDCEHLVDRREEGRLPRHKMVICRSKSNWPEQTVILDSMEKGLIPHGLFSKVFQQHLKWRVQSATQQHFEFCVQQFPGELSQAAAQAFAAHISQLSREVSSEGAAFVNSKEGAADSSDSEEEGEGLPDPVEEGEFNAEGLRKEKQLQVRQDAPKYKIREVPTHELYRFLPDHWRKHGMLDTIEPWSIVFVDNITMAHGKGFPDSKLLVAYDLATSGIRIKTYKHKHELGELMDEIIVEEALNKRSQRITIGADGDGAMALVREACRRQGLSWLPIPPWQPHLNPVELAVSHLKECTASVLIGACTPGGPITPALAHYAAKYIAYINERFAAVRRGETYRGDHHSFRSPWQLNVGVAPRLDRLVPWGQPGYAYVPEDLRKARGAPKYLRSEPILLIGYQFMYTNVYKVLTRHGTTIDTEQVTWCMDMPRGVFPPTGGESKAKEKLSRLGIDEVMPDLKPASISPKVDKASQDSMSVKPPQSGTSEKGAKAIIRLNVDKVLSGKGPKPHILARCEALDGTPYDEATGKRFVNHKGELKPYRKMDLEYDLHCQWLRVDIEDSDGKVLIVNSEAHAAFAGRWGHHQFACLVAAQGKATTDMGKLSNSINAAAFMAMRDMDWRRYLYGPDHSPIMAAYNKEWDSLCGSVLRELDKSDPEYADAVRLATKGRMILEFKRVGIWKARVVVRGDTEDRERLDGPDFVYAANVCEFSGVRNMLFDPRPNPHKQGKNSDPTVIASADIAVAYTQADYFGPQEPKRYLKVLDPVLQEWRFFRQIGNLYGSGSAAARWEKTFVQFMTSSDAGFVQGKNEPCAFYHAQRRLQILSYCDDLLVRGARSEVEWFFKVLGKRFNIKPPVYLSKNEMLDHLGMVIIEDDDGLYLSMQSYIEVICHKLGIDIDKYQKKPKKVPMSKPITNLEPCTREEAKLFMTACGMCGWVSATGRPEIRVYHSRVSQYMASPVKGALEAVLGIVKYLASTKTHCLFQPWLTSSNADSFKWRCYSDSDQSSNPELINRRRSQLSYIATRGSAPVAFGSKCTSVKLPSDLDCFGPSYFGLDKPVCHPMMTDIAADVSSAAAEVYAASVATNELLHLSYLCDEMGIDFPRPIPLEVDNQTCIHFSKGTTQRSKMKHIDARQAWVEALRDDNIVKFSWVPTRDNLADLNSKILPVPRFETLRDKILRPRALPDLKSAEVSEAAMARCDSLVLHQRQHKGMGFSASHRLFPSPGHSARHANRCAETGQSHLAVSDNITRLMAPGARCTRTRVSGSYISTWLCTTTVGANSVQRGFSQTPRTRPKSQSHWQVKRKWGDTPK